MSYNKKNNLLGWAMFLLAALVYLSTAERYFSFWDCGEYISSAVKLEVTHSPGAALFQLIGAFFSIFSFENGKLFSLIINAMSGMFSAFTILFLFWTITSIAKNYLSTKNLTQQQEIIVFGSGLVGALSFAFSDTFWFSAVEGEVYSMASLFTAILLWLICKWENRANQPDSNKWLLLISFVIGLSIGVHLMVILALPAVCFLYYAKKYQFTPKSFAIANGITLLILILVFKIIFPLVMTYFGKMEIFFVNEIGLPFNSGTVIAAIVLVGFFYLTIDYTQKNGYGLANSIVLSVLFMLIGFSCWLMIPIRANANPPMNLNDPDNAIGLLDYYNREQYGDWPTIYGTNYTAYLDPNGIEGLINKGPVYEKSEENKKYIVVSQRSDYKFSPDHVGFFPRMYSPDPNNIKNYKTIAGSPETYTSIDPETEEEIKRYKKPSFAQNFMFFMNYQINYMYTRYFLWNFVGKQNDLEGNLEITKGNWESGISLFDSIQDKSQLPEKYTNKGTNHYYFLPLLLGLMGLFFHINKDFTRFYALLSLFLLTGVGIILYTSMKPFEPRERDYALVSSFYAFSIWIGLGVLAIFSFLKSQKSTSSSLGIVLVLLSIPALMAFENWDDHNRSTRKAAYDLARNYLDPLDKNSILFVYGDNDTYPIWAIQETEKYRSDVKVINTTLLSTGWNIQQAQRKTYDAMPIPSYLKTNEYRDGKNESIKIVPKEELLYFITEMHKQQPISASTFDYIKSFITKDSISVQEAMEFIRKKDKGKDIILNVFYGEDADSQNFVPSNKFYMKVNKKNIVSSGIINAKELNQVNDYISWTYEGGSITKSNYVFLAMLANYQWDRAIYFSSGGLYDDENIFYLRDYLQQEGFTYKFTPIKTKPSEYEDYGRIDTEILYKNIKAFYWSGFDNPKAYFDETCTRNISTYRNTISLASRQLIKENKKEKANEIMELLLEKIPPKTYGYSISMAEIAHNFILMGKEKKGLKMATEYKKQVLAEIRFFESLSNNQRANLLNETKRAGLEYGTVVDAIANAYKEKGNPKKGFAYVQQSINELEKPYKKLLFRMGSESREQQMDNENVVQVYVSAFNLLFESAANYDKEYAAEKKQEIISPIIELEE
jgi:hypothetical protein